MISEEQVTKNIISWLLESNWEIISYDFPQNNVGVRLHPNNSKEKNTGIIIPDIIAVRDARCLFFENKNRYCHLDFLKQHKLVVGNEYHDDIARFFCNYDIKSIYYGIGLPYEAVRNIPVEEYYLVDFVISTTQGGGVKIYKGEECF